ncbi:MAG: DUF932 domain-containing protein [Desulfobacteraceae bacterium]|jgi:phage/plasmid-like protein (TIGR03299 family)|nr:MAG: DUF932 domain-containing protein [Desulfobacteraceae bacterium]
MPANVGEMFYYGEVPWHGKGTKLEELANMEEAIKNGGLDWEVQTIPLVTAEFPPSPVSGRVAIVRKDKPPGHKGRALGVAYDGFKPLQNREGIRIFDAIFGKGERVYCTGGYLGAGEVVWVLAQLPKSIEIVKGDKVKPYALFTNSHDGSIAIDVRLTTIRVVCQNTLSMALKEQDKKSIFKKAHQGNYGDLEKDMEEFFSDMLKSVDRIETNFKAMLERRFDDDEIREYIENLLPMPPKKDQKKLSPKALNRYLGDVARIQSARLQIGRLASKGLGTEIIGVTGSLWGVFNASLEYVDHHKKKSVDDLSWSLFGSSTLLKRRAFDLAMEYVKPNPIEKIHQKGLFETSGMSGTSY